MRNHRRDAIELLKELEKDKEITEDDAAPRPGEDPGAHQGRTSSSRQVLKAKEDEIMEV